jgi:hypothetical protein
MVTGSQVREQGVREEYMSKGWAELLETETLKGIMLGGTLIIGLLGKSHVQPGMP